MLKTSVNSLIALALALVSVSSHAADGRWFEIEVILFKQNQHNTTETLKNAQADLSDYQGQGSLLEEGYLGTLSNACLAGEIAPPMRSQSILSGGSNQSSGNCEFSKDDLVNLNALPKVTNPTTQTHMQTPYVLSKEQLQFTEQRADLERKGRSILLHTGWRFPGESKRNAPKHRLFAGKQVAKLGDTSENDGDFYSYSSPKFQSVWEVDGFLKVHLNHYLYITSHLLYRDSGDTQDTVSGEFSQFRRVISGEVHYFDHPQVGMIVQIRRFNH